MPKKHAPSYTHQKPASTYVHPSLLASSSSTPSTSSPQPPRTVTAHLQTLRLSQSPRPTPAQLSALSNNISARTVPPDLRRILRIPEVGAPRPKSGGRGGVIRGSERGTGRAPPGPAVPESWLSGGMGRKDGAGRGRQRGRAESAGKGGLVVGRLARVVDQEFQRLPRPRSLTHECLRTFALHWKDLIEYEQHYISELPVAMREALLCYLAVYGGRSDLDWRSFKTLFQPAEGEGIGGGEEVRFLDLSGLLGESLSLVELGKCLKRPATSRVAIYDLENLHISTAPSCASKDSTPIADSWEDEIEAAATTFVHSNPPDAATPILSLPTPHFTELTHLCLAHPGSSALWPTLLSLSLAQSLTKLTHLSLAYWPQPTLTPHATTTDMVSNHSGTSVPLGGTHYYSELDEDWYEAASVLRRFASGTYGLQWLDLEGCGWIGALTWGFDGDEQGDTADTGAVRSGRAASVRRAGDEDWHTTPTSTGPNFLTTWRYITYLNLSQGWIPSEKSALQRLPASVVALQLMAWLRENNGKEEVRARYKLEDGSSAREVAAWVEKEKLARAVGRKVQEIRSKGSGEWCMVDFGWVPVGRGLVGGKKVD